MKVKSQVMSNIVRMLENEGPFKDVIYVILENVSKYLKMPDVTVMQYDEERTCLYPVLSYGGRHHLIQAAEVQAAAAQTAPQGTVERQVKAAADSPLYGEKLCYYRADTAQEPVRMALADANIKTSVTAPVKAEDKVRMYLCVSDSTNDVELDAEQLRFVSDVANVIQSIMQERISKDSLSYSYEVLKGILGSIDSGIMVYDRQTKEVLFENDIVKNCNDIKRVIQTCVTFYFTGENTKSIHKLTLESQRSELQSKKADLDAQNSQMRAKQNELNSSVAAAQMSAAEAQQAQKDAQAAIESDEMNYEAVKKQIQKMIAAAAASKPTLSFTGFICPLKSYSRISSEYGWRKNPVTGVNKLHAGTDFAAPGGTPIYAAASGYVQVAGWSSGGYGNYVIIYHGKMSDGNQYSTLYGHMRSVATSAGKYVQQGEIIGYVGSTGNSTGNHLHLEVWKGGSKANAVNPRGYIPMK